MTSVKQLYEKETVPDEKLRMIKPK